MGNILGIDIGSRFIKVIEIEKIPNPKLINAILFETPYISAQEKEQTQIDASVVWAEIAKYIPAKRLNTSVIGINIPPVSISTIYLLLPRMSKNEIAEAAIVEARRNMIPISGPDHVFQHFILGEKVIDKIPKVEVVIIRTEKKCIQNILNFSKKIDNTPFLITPTCYTLPSIIPKDNWVKDEDVVFVDIGFSSLNISICREVNLLFMRNVVFGLRDIVKEFSYHFGLAEGEAENLIKGQDILQIPFDLKDKVTINEEIMQQKFEAKKEKRPVNPLELRMLWQSYIDRIVHELRRSLIYHKEQFKTRRIEHIYFLGGGSQIKNLVITLSGLIGGQCELILPFKGLSLAKDKRFEDESLSTPIFTNASSIALTILNKGKKISINFLPSELKKKEIVATRRLVLLLGMISLISIFALASINLFLTTHSVKQNIRLTDLRLKQLKHKTDGLKDLNQRDKNIHQLSSQIEALTKDRQNIYLSLKDLARIIPKDILLTYLKISKGDAFSPGGVTSGGGAFSPEVTPGGSSSTTNTKELYRIEIKGSIFADYEETIKIIAEFRQNLEKTPYFSNIQVEPLKLEEISTSQMSKDIQEILLTTPRTREFSLTAELNKK